MKRFLARILFLVVIFQSAIERLRVIEMAGITSTELKLPRIRKPLWIIVIIVVLCALVFFLLPPLDYGVEQRVAAAIHIIPDAELGYSETTDVSEFMKIKKIIYWINSPYEQVKAYPFVTNYRVRSDPHWSGFSQITPSYSYQIYYLSDLPQKELDSALYFAPSDIRDEPFNLTSLWFYIIAANRAGDKDYFIDELDYENLAGKETTGTYIAYTYRIR